MWIVSLQPQLEFSLPVLIDVDGLLATVDIIQIGQKLVLNVQSTVTAANNKETSRDKEEDTAAAIPLLLLLITVKGKRQGKETEIILFYTREKRQR